MGFEENGPFMSSLQYHKGPQEMSIREHRDTEVNSTRQIEIQRFVQRTLLYSLVFRKSKWSEQGKVANKQDNYYHNGYIYGQIYVCWRFLCAIQMGIVLSVVVVEIQYRSLSDVKNHFITNRKVANAIMYVQKVKLLLLSSSMCIYLISVCLSPVGWMHGRSFIISEKLSYFPMTRSVLQSVRWS